MAEVHPSAIVDDQAELADGVVVGPGCVIEGAVRVGNGTRLLHRVTLQGPMRLGERNVIYPNACLGLPPQDVKYDPNEAGSGLVIGSDNIFREGVTVHRATGEMPTTIGNGNMLMVNSHVGHDSVLQDHCVLVNGALVAGHCEIGDRALLSGNSAVHQFCRVGRLGVVVGGGIVIQDLPPFCMTNASRSVGGINRVGLRRAGLGEHATAVKEAFNILYRQRHLPREAAHLIEAQMGDEPLCMELAAFIKSTKRGVTPFGRRGRG
ncbi:MAG: acyl-ACP--UDP-N-acetylglucosamine O-acyltransferase [Phycisphaeraceae bacterium]